MHGSKLTQRHVRADCIPNSRRPVLTLHAPPVCKLRAPLLQRAAAVPLAARRPSEAWPFSAIPTSLWIAEANRWRTRPGVHLMLCTRDPDMHGRGAPCVLLQCYPCLQSGACS